jgi:membrane associated rhomboid family serine protease
MLTSAVVAAQLPALGASRPEIAHGQVWRLVTGSLVHGLGVPQLAVNMAAFVLGGALVTRRGTEAPDRHRTVRG